MKKKLHNTMACYGASFLAEQAELGWHILKRENAKGGVIC